MTTKEVYKKAKELMNQKCGNNYGWEAFALNEILYMWAMHFEELLNKKPPGKE